MQSKIWGRFRYSYYICGIPHLKVPHHIVTCFLVFHLFKGGGVWDISPYLHFLSDQQLGLTIYKPSTYLPTRFPLMVACNVEDFGIPILVVLNCDLQSSLHEKSPRVVAKKKSSHKGRVLALKGT